MRSGNGEVRELPKGWIWTTLEDISEILDSYRKPINAEERAKRIQGKGEKELFPYYGATGKVGYIDNYLLDGTYILLGEDGAPFLEFSKNKAYLVVGKIWVNNHAHILNTSASKEYLCHFLNQVDYHNFVTGTTRLKLNQASMKRIPIKLPPLQEQNRIVEKIEELFSDVDQGVESLKTAQKQLKVYRQAVLKWAFEGKLTEEWRKQQTTLKTGEALLAQIKSERENRYQQQLAEGEEKVREWEAIGKVGKKPTKPHKLKELLPLTEAELLECPKLPDGWCWASVEQLGYVQLGRQRSPQNRSQDFPTKYIRAANITENGFELIDVLDMEFKPHEFKQYQLKDGDILLSEASGSPEQVGKPAVWRNQIPNCCFQNTVIRFRPIYLSSEYFLLVFKNLYSNGFFSNISSGVGINHLSANKFSAIPVPLAPLEEQEEIVQEIESRLSICDQLEATIIENLQKAEALRQSILKQVFEGKLVPQDPNDEPSEKLLERIKAERQATQPPKTSNQLKIKGL